MPANRQGDSSTAVLGCRRVAHPPAPSSDRARTGNAPRRNLGSQSTSGHESSCALYRSSELRRGAVHAVPDSVRDGRPNRADTATDSGSCGANPSPPNEPRTFAQTSTEKGQWSFAHRRVSERPPPERLSRMRRRVGAGGGRPPPRPGGTANVTRAAGPRPEAKAAELAPDPGTGARIRGLIPKVSLGTMCL